MTDLYSGLTESLPMAKVAKSQAMPIKDYIRRPLCDAREEPFLFSQHEP